MRRVIVVACAALVFAAPTAPRTSAQDAPATVANVTKPPRRTGHDLYAAVLDFNRKTLVGAYDKSGKKDPKWDEAARALLEAAAKAFTSASVLEFYWPEPSPTPAQRVELAKKAVDAGCDDPLVLYCYQNALAPTNPQEALKVLRQSAAGLKAGDYPPYRAFAALSRLAATTDDEKEREQAAKEAGDYRVKMLCGKMDDGARRTLFTAISTELNAPPTRKTAETLVAALDGRDDAEPWVRDAFAGRLHLLLAWDARSSMSTKSYQDFGRNMKSARERLTRAWKAQPQLPEPPTEMITVCLSDFLETEEDPVDWFQRAIDAQADYTRAYTAIFNALNTRFGGGHQRLEEIADKCVQDGHYDTVVPWQYVSAMQVLRTESEDWPSLLGDPKRYDSLAKLTEGYAKARAAKPDANWYKSYHAAVAWAAGKYDDAKKVLDELGSKADPRPFEAMGARDGGEAMLEAVVMAGPHADALRQAAASLQGGDPVAASEAFNGIESKLGPKDRARPFIEARARGAAAALKYTNGEWGDVQPVKSLGDWKKVVGTWKLEPDGTLVGDADNKPASQKQKAIVWTGMTIGRSEPFEISGHMEFTADPGNNPCAAGPALVAAGNETDRGFMMADVGRKQVVQFFAASPPTAPAEVAKANDFLVRYDGKNFTMELNGKPVGQPFAMPRNRFTGGIHVGVGGVGSVPVKFTKLRVRRIVDKGQGQ